MGLRDLFTTARLVSLLVMASATTSLEQKPSLSLDERLETMEAKIESLADGFAKRSAIDSDRRKKDMEEILTRIIRLTDSIEEEFSVMKGDVKNSWQQLQLITGESASKTLNAFQTVANKLNDTLQRKMQTALKDFVPQACKIFASIPQKPPSLIYYNRFPGVHTPLVCDTVTDGGGWIVIQRRSLYSTGFFHGWEKYRNGFGTMDKDFWLGNENIHTITSSGQYELRVDLESTFARYDRFFLASEADKYRLHLGSYSGTAGDHLAFNNGSVFTTWDVDSDKCNSPWRYKGSWWYKCGTIANLNGDWHIGFLWDDTTLRFSEMKIRQLNR
ncbi:hypothetical protein EGW08_023119 [Elysia chlorotica]|uniref:Fibrinogen C-terminal domain-containing protein n=1 Tax=Elysia chlorotica TaxID=188477 RepID=A0A433SJ90_ELYCH|nr:hypothetical protein EGW08_023119 [Elysia chlorotica]